MSEIVILHLTDLHASNSNERGVLFITEAIIADLRALEIIPDILIFSGDIANRGQREEYDTALSNQIEIIIKEFKISRNNIIVVPGNHDVNRSKIAPEEFSARDKALDNQNYSEEILFSETWKTKLEDYGHFQKNLIDQDLSAAYQKTISFNETNVTIRAVNSAWLSLDNGESKKLVLTESQVMPDLDSLDLGIKILVLHHPLEELSNDSFSRVSPIVAKEFDVVLCGHLHEEVPKATTLPTVGQAIFIQGAAAEETTRTATGYGVVVINPGQERVTLLARTYYKNRRVYDKNLQISGSGELSFHLSGKPYNIFSKTLNTAPLPVPTTNYQKRLNEMISRSQKFRVDPHWVRPKINQVRLDDSKIKVVKSIDKPDMELDTVTVINGPKEVGKTGLLFEMAANIESQRVRPPIVFWENKQVIKENICSSLYLDVANARKSAGLTDPVYTVCLIDDVPDICEDTLEGIYNHAKENNYKVAIVVRSEQRFRQLMASPTLKCKFWQMKYWGPSRIKELLELALAGKEIDFNIAFRYILETFESLDIQPSPPMVNFLISAILNHGEEISSLSFIDMMDQYEFFHLGNRAGLGKDRYHRGNLLALLAYKIAKTEDLSLPSQEARKIVATYFDQIDIRGDIDSFFEDTYQDAFLVEIEDRIQFGSDTFLDYYLALGFQNKLFDIEEFQGNLRESMQIGEAFAILAGKVRNDYSLVEKLLHNLESEFPLGAYPPFSVENLNELMGGVQFVNHSSAEEAEAHLRASQATQPDVAILDEAFAKTKKEEDEVRKISRREIQSPEFLDRFELLIVSIKSLSKVYRNLESIDKDKKREVLFTALSYYKLLTFFFALSSGMSFQKYDKKSKHPKVVSALFSFFGAFVGIHIFAKSTFNESLAEVIKSAFQDDRADDFDKLLLIFLLLEIRPKGYDKMIREFIAACKSRVIVDLVLLKICEVYVSPCQIKNEQGMLDLYRDISDSGKGNVNATDPKNPQLTKEIIGMQRDRERSKREKEQLLEGHIVTD